MLSLALPLVQGVYKLQWLGEAGPFNAWDKDGAEHIAYDKSSYRAFIASAEEAKLRVISVQSPKNPTQVASLAVGDILKSKCTEQDCEYEGHLFGDAGNTEAKCGAPTLISTSWAADKDACKLSCKNQETCAFWTFKSESSKQCLLHRDYTETQAEDNGETLEECRKTGYSVHITTSGRNAGNINHNSVSGPVNCGKVSIESIQSVAVTSVANYPNQIVVTASPNILQWGNGYLSFFDATTYEYLGCAAAGNKPEGIASHSGKVACVDEGSARKDGDWDHEGSMTMCDVTSNGNPTNAVPFPAPTINCNTYHFNAANWDTTKGAFPSAAALRSKGVRLYGPYADQVSSDIEPEGGAFSSDGSKFVVVLQDNNAYMTFDVASKKYIEMRGLGMEEMDTDPSDKDDVVHFRSEFGTDKVKLYGLYMPDQLASFTVNGKEYFISANEGDTRDGKDPIGRTGDVEGEELRMGDAKCDCSDCCAKSELGRLLTTWFAPSNLAQDACVSRSSRSATGRASAGRVAAARATRASAGRVAAARATTERRI